MSTTVPKTEKGRATRERIVRAAADLVAERGTAETSLDDVRARAAVSKSQLYHYFADRDDLLRAVAQSTSDAVIDAQAGAFADIDTLAGLERWADGVVAIQVARGAHGGCPIGSLAGQLAERDAGAREALADGLDRWQEAIAGGLRAMAERGELRPGADPDVLALRVLASVQGGLLLTQVRRDPAQVRAVLDGALDQVRAHRS